MMADTKHVAGNLSHFRQLMDAFEGKDLGYFLKNVTDPSGPLDCRVTLPSGKEEHCSTQEEFEQLAKVYMQWSAPDRESGSQLIFSKALVSP